MLLSSSVSAIIQSVVIVFYSCLNELVFNSQLYYSILLLSSSASFIQSVVHLFRCLHQVVLYSILLLSSSAGEEHKVVAVLRQDDCFLSKGGYLHIFGATWYELLNVQNQVKIDR